MYIYKYNVSGTKIVAPSLETTPRGVETPSPSADHWSSRANFVASLHYIYNFNKPQPKTVMSRVNTVRNGVELLVQRIVTAIGWLLNCRGFVAARRCAECPSVYCRRSAAYWEDSVLGSGLLSNIGSPNSMETKR